MPVINRAFNGKMNLDVQDYRIPEADYIDALNITRDAQGSGQDKVVSNIVGNQNVSRVLPAGTNKCIGKYPDLIRYRLYYFVWNSNGHHVILYYDGNANTITYLLESKADSAGVDILNFDPSYRINHIDIIYRDVEGDLLFFVDSLKRPSYLNVTSDYNPWLRSYLDVAKTPPLMPPRVTYENDTDVNVNNLKNCLFQFKIRFEYADFQKTVYPVGSIIPLPNEPFSNTVDSDKSKNARIAVYVPTGDITVKKIEIWGIQVAENSNTDYTNTTGNYFLIKSLDKAQLGLLDNDIYKFLFYNDSVYPFGDINDQLELLDYVPQETNTQALPNGNTIVYAGIKEGYNLPNIDVSVDATGLVVPPLSTYNGLLFFGARGGVDSGGSGDIITFYLSGTGTNTAGVPTTLNNCKTIFRVDAKSSVGADISFQYYNSSSSATTTSIFDGLKAAAAAQGWTFVGQSVSTLTLSFSGLNYNYAQVKKNVIDTLDNHENISFAYQLQSAEEFAIEYLDSKYRTTGAIPVKVSSITTNKDNTEIFIPQITLTINSRPPIEAFYYNILRATRRTYQKQLYWVTSGTFFTTDNVSSIKYAYVNVANIQTYNEQIEGSVPVVSYSFSAGDRIRFLKRFDADQTPHNINYFDYEIVSLEVNPQKDGITQIGNFIKFVYPTADISADFAFEGFNFQNYKVFIYSYVKHSAATNIYYRFARQYAIGNAGTANAYHIASDQTQTSNLATPAKVIMTEGDLFYRYRTVPAGSTYNMNATSFTTINQYITDQINFDSGSVTPIDTGSYIIQPQERHDAGDIFNPAATPAYSDTYYLFYNKSAQTISIRIKCTVTFITQDPAYSQVFGKIVTSNTTATVFQLSTKTNSLIAEQQYEMEVDKVVAIPAGGKFYFILQDSDGSLSTTLTVGAFPVTVEVFNPITISLIEQSYSDKYNIITNSDSTPVPYDENAKQLYYPTLIRFSQSYQNDTSINGTNRFYAADFDTYDRSLGDIMKLFIEGRYLFVFQKLDVGVVPILTQIVKDVEGNPLEANSDQLINKITYPYQGRHGIGDLVESFAYGKGAKYFSNDNKNEVCRLSQDGIIVLSKLYDTNAFFVERLPNFRKDLNNGIVPAGQVYKGDPCVIGCFDEYTNKYIIALEEINRYSDPNTLIFHQDAETLIFNETRDESEGFETKWSCKPEDITCLGTLVISFKDGNLWTHDSDVNCNYFGVQYDAFITQVFNDFSIDKKTWISVNETSNVVWDCPSVYTQVNSYGTQRQESLLTAAHFGKLENEWSAAFIRDANSRGGLVNGDFLKGGYIVVKFRYRNATDFVFLNAVSIKYINSPLNSK